MQITALKITLKEDIIGRFIQLIYFIYDTSNVNVVYVKKRKYVSLSVSQCCQKYDIFSVGLCDINRSIGLQKGLNDFNIK